MVSEAQTADWLQCDAAN